MPIIGCWEHLRVDGMKPKIVIVDENNNIIGHKERETLKREDIYRVSALWLTNGKGDILLARRALTKSHDPGKWGPAVAGTVEEGETYHSNIVKETAEELGLKDIKPEKGPMIRISSRHNYFCQWYILTIDKPITQFKIQKAEVEEIKWFSKGELAEQLDKKPEEFLKRMKRYLGAFK